MTSGVILNSNISRENIALTISVTKKNLWGLHGINGESNVDIYVEIVYVI